MTPQSEMSLAGAGVVFRQASEVSDVLWEKLRSADWKDRRFYSLLEETLPGQFQHRYLTLREAGGQQAGIVPCFLVDQDVVAALPGAVRATVAAMRRVLPRFLQMRMLMVGCPIGEGQFAATEGTLLPAVAVALDLMAKQNGASMIIFKDFPRGARPVLEGLSKRGYRRVPSMPAARLDLDFATFEEYMERKLSRIFRKNLRRKFKKSARHGRLEMEVVNDVTPWVDRVHELYLQTYARAGMRFEKLTREFFARVGQEFGDRARYFLWRHEGRLVAFNLCMLHEGVLHDLDIGLDYGIALELHLYFVTWRDIIEWCLLHEVNAYQTGPLNYDPKLHLRLRLVPLDLYARHTSRWLNPFFQFALHYLQPARHDPLIRRFENADEL